MKDVIKNAENLQNKNQENGCLNIACMTKVQRGVIVLLKAANQTQS